ncbi:MAG: choice-of-anchor J domain-containing protein, partial [Flavisolibacter sp.]
FINYQTFGSNPCYVEPNFNRGRTATHEIGHYLGLYHIWADDGGACTGDDFQDLSIVGSSTILPAGLFNPAGNGNTPGDIGDTPNQGNSTPGTCPTGIAADACSPIATGKMYQNYMDYTSDACYSMFTNKQVERMEWVVNNARTSLKNSLGCQVPASVINLDIAPLASVNPGGFEIVGCTINNFSIALACGGPVSPKVRVVNNGLNAITSLTVGYRLDNAAAISQNFNVNIPSGGTVVITLTAFNTGTGSHTIRFFTSNPNGGADQVPANDTLIQNFSVNPSLSLPQTADFETATFPPANWTIFNPNNDFTWQRRTPGRNGSAGAMWINNYSVDGTNNVDEFRSSNINVTGIPSATLSFDLAHKYYNLSGYHDTLSVLISTDCGSTWTTIYKKWGTTLATAGSMNTAYTNPADGDWRTELITLNAATLAPGQIQFAFRNTSRYGNNIFIDNISIQLPASRDMRLVSIDQPTATICTPVFAPQVTVNNTGLETITSFIIGYRFDNGPYTTTTFNQSVVPGASATVTLPSGTTTSGSHIIKAYVGNPTSISGTGDTDPSNDTLTKSFTVLSLVTPPVVEGFESSFPPSGWTLNNPNNNATWIKRSPGRNSANSAFIDNFNNNLVGQSDELKIPFMDVSGADSVLFSFDLAHKNYPGANDRLTILATTDCGNTYTTIYNKAGSTLSTAGSSTGEYATPLPTDWRNERIALNNTFSSTGSIGFIIRSTNDYGNNLFIDNVNISSLYKRDVQLVSINSPNSVLCSNSLTPSVTLKNVGMETVTGVKISYSIDNGAVSTTTLTGISLARDQQTTVSLNPANVTALGAHIITVYSWDPVSATGTGDLNTKNDTLRKAFNIAGSTTAPLSENFTTTTFPPAGWSVVNPDGGLTWSRNPIGNGNAGSAFVNTYNYSQLGQKDELISPNISYQGVDSVTLKFDLSASTYSYPGSTAIPIDTLTVLASNDCGNTFTTVYQKFGEDLQTVNDPNNSQTAEFYPQFSYQWRNESVDLTGLGGQGPLMLFFRVSNNYENNIFIDNVNLTTRILPDKIKQQGYLVLPTGFQNSFNVWHVQQPTMMRYIHVFNSAGQLVFARQFNGNGQKTETVDLSSKAAGVYLVKIVYEDENRNVTERVVKY